MRKTVQPAKATGMRWQRRRKTRRVGALQEAERSAFLVKVASSGEAEALAGPVPVTRDFIYNMSGEPPDNSV